MYQEGNVVVAAAIADHAHGNLFQCLAGKCLETYVFRVQVAYHTNDDHVSVYGYGSVFLQFVCDVAQLAYVVNGYANAHFAGTYHVDAGLV